MTHMCHKKKSCYTNGTSIIRYVDWGEAYPWIFTYTGDDDIWWRVYPGDI